MVEGKTEDSVEFERPGVSGRLLVRGDRFELDAKLGFLLGAFSKRIEAEIEQNLDALLAASEKAKPKSAPRKAAGAAAKKP